MGGLSVWKDSEIKNLVEDRKGLITNEVGVKPFYTISNNPQTCYNLKASDSCNKTWEVNATGTLGGTWEFFTIFEPVNYAGYIEVDQTGKVNITIV